jgi:hypothetical protein
LQDQAHNRNPIFRAILICPIANDLAQCALTLNQTLEVKAMSLRQLEAEFTAQSRRLLVGSLGAVMALFAASISVMLLWR